MTKVEMMQNISRWVYASCHGHFLANIDQAKLPLFPEMYSKSEAERVITNFCEYRYDGPFYRPTSRTRTEIRFELNILIQSTMTDDDFHRPQVDVGLVVAAFTAIPIYAYGDGPLDDETFLGCASLTKQGRETEIKASQFWEIDPQLKLYQATVEASYVLKIKTS